MKLEQAIRDIVTVYGEEIVTEARFVHLLSDYQAFEEPITRFVIKAMVDEGLTKKLLSLPEWGNDAQVLANGFVSQTGFQRDKVNDIISKLGMGLSRGSAVKKSPHAQDGSNIDTSQPSYIPGYGTPVPYTLDRTDLDVIPCFTDTLEEDEYAFDDTLKRIIIPEGVRHIKYGAFRNCKNLKAVSFPSTLQTIESMAFADDRLEQVDFRGVVPPKISNSWSGESHLSHTRFCVPIQAIDVYANILFPVSSEIDIFPIDMPLRGEYGFIAMTYFNSDASRRKFPTDTVIRIKTQGIVTRADFMNWYSYMKQATSLIVKFEEGVTEIAAYSMPTNYEDDCSVRIILPKSVRRIGRCALGDPNFDEKLCVEFRSPVPPDIEFIFNGLPESCCFLVPTGSKCDYEKLAVVKDRVPDITIKEV